MVIKTNFPIFIIVILSGVVLTFSNQASDIENLLKFKDSLQNVGNQMSNWSSSISPCKGNAIPQWQGVICEGENVWGLKLDHMGLKGTINLDALKELSNLRTLSLINNSFEGPLPEIKNLGYMKTIFLSDNDFQGDIPAKAFEDMQSLKKLHLDNNKLTGRIPNSLTTLGKLTELNLQNNQFSGQIPYFAKDRLIVLNVSNNKLQGPIPFNLSSMDASFFSGNTELCGAPLHHQCNSNSSMPKITTETKILLAIVLVASIAAIGSVIIILLRRKRTVDLEKRTSQNMKNVALPNNLKNHEHDSMTPDGLLDNGKNLSFLRDDRVKFDMNDLLKSSAEILDNGTFGLTYKAAIIGKTTVIVKRYKEMHNVNKEEFHQHMRRLGRLNHINLIPLVACYYKKEEKLLVSDHIDSVSLAIYLHGKSFFSLLSIINLME
ncbi:transmembrane signal receptor [Lithospermum erythrorhizon]|uniref:Transmembrane signal receptor n=1 Tax=Lithospermum erythrorhizon TaxID=34254 RepID=A0AAV3RA71_LITER